MKTRVNWFGLAGGLATIAVTVASLFCPWWQITAGEDLVKADVSPLDANFNFLGNTFTVPLIFAFNLTGFLFLVASSITMLAYSVNPAKAYSKYLLGFAYKKPLLILLVFVIVLFAIRVIIQLVLGLNVPLVGSETATLPETMTKDVTVKVLLSAEFKWPFWLAAGAAVLCIAARLYHKKIIKTPVSDKLKAL